MKIFGTWEILGTYDIYIQIVYKAGRHVRKVKNTVRQNSPHGRDNRKGLSQMYIDSRYKN
jgi:hypothetical protein